MEKREVLSGQIWSHYKNPSRWYEIIGTALNSDTLEELVIYKALYKDEFPFGQIWARPKKEFLEKVEKDGKKIERFTLVENK